MSTFPFFKTVAVWPERPIDMLAACSKIPLWGSNNSVEEKGLDSPPLPENPPAISTLPEGRSVALWLARAICIAAISVTVPGPDGQGAPGRENASTGTRINPSEKKYLVFMRRKFMEFLLDLLSGVHDAARRRGVNSSRRRKRSNSSEELSEA